MKTRVSPKYFVADCKNEDELSENEYDEKFSKGVDVRWYRSTISMIFLLSTKLSENPITN